MVLYSHWGLPKIKQTQPFSQALKNLIRTGKKNVFVRRAFTSDMSRGPNHIVRNLIYSQVKHKADAPQAGKFIRKVKTITKN